MKSAHIIILLIAAVALIGCGPSYDEMKKQSRAEQEKLRREDSSAFKVGVMPTLDCLPMYVAKDYKMFDSTKADIRLKPFKAQIDCDAALASGKLEGCITDIVRGQHLKKRGVKLDYVAATNAYWQIISNRTARIRRLNQLTDKMIAITRFSATALLADYAVDSARLKHDEVFKIQINDIDLRLLMLLNNEMDAMALPEPQATKARMYKHPVLMDSRDKDMYFGVIAFRSDAMKDKRRQQQFKVFVDGYNAACDSINKKGLAHYSSTLKRHYNIDDKTIKALPEMKFKHANAPRKKDIDTADKWLK